MANGVFLSGQKNVRGYYGLQVQPTFEQSLRAMETKKLRIEIPNRAAKWYANSPWRAKILEEEQLYNDYEHASINFREQGDFLPETAARVQPSAAAQDPLFAEYERIHSDLGNRSRIMRVMEEHARMQRIDEMHMAHERLRAQMEGRHHEHPTVRLERQESESVGHVAPEDVVQPRRTVKRRLVPIQQSVELGYPAVRELPTFEQLNYPPVTVDEGTSASSSRPPTYSAMAAAAADTR